MSTETLGTALPKEIERVQELISIYDNLPGGVGQFAIACMKMDIVAAQNAMMEGDVVAMLKVYESLKGYQ